MGRLTEKELKGKEIHIVGVSGMEGFAVAEFLVAKGARVVGHDFQTKTELRKNFLAVREYLAGEERTGEWQKFQNLPIELKLQDQYLAGIEGADLIFLPQAWFRYKFNDKLKELKKIPTVGILDLYFSFCPAKIIGITGSSGKSTTTQLIYQIVKEEKRALVSGNDRDMPPVLDQIEKLGPEDYLILEISNRQLINFKDRPAISVITNLFPTHLDDHSDLADYKYVKQNLIRFQNKDDQAVLNFDDPKVLGLEPATKAEVYYFSLGGEPKQDSYQGSYLKEKKGFWAGEKEPILDFTQVKVPGRHNKANILVAMTVGKLAGISQGGIQKGCYNFKGLTHRLEFVVEKKGVRFYEDSQSTNPLSTVAAVESFPEPIILIAGGKKKPNPEDFNIMVEELVNKRNIRGVLLVGEAAHQIKKEFDKLTSKAEQKAINLTFLDTLERAVDQAGKLARPGDIVLLSPGSESFGEFKDYRERGDKFKELVRS